MNEPLPIADDPAPTSGERIRAARIKKGFSQDRLARELNVSRSAVAQWETNRSGQLNANLQKLARALDVTVEYIVNGGPGFMSMSAYDRREFSMLRLFRECDVEDQKALLVMARRLAGPAAALLDQADSLDDDTKQPD